MAILLFEMQSPILRARMYYVLYTVYCTVLQTVQNIDGEWSGVEVQSSEK